MRNRITILKEKMLDEKRYASIEQARIITRIYKENETLSVPMKRALSLKAALEEIEIGVEKEESVLVRAIEKIDELELSNIYFIREDAMEIDKILNKNISKIYLNFSDPWPKERHAKRRLTSPVFLKKYDHIFKMGKEIQMKTDNHKLFEYSLRSLVDYGYKIKELSLNLYEDDHEDNVATEYETKFVKMGKIIYRALFSCD